MKTYQVTLVTKITRTYTIDAETADEAISFAYDNDNLYDEESIDDDSYAEEI